jgi:DNA (cytosine-5)-methyltransferase 1
VRGTGDARDHLAPPDVLAGVSVDATYVSLFSGIGGLDLGLDRAGWRCVGQVEINPYCRKVLERHWPTVPRFGDIRELTGHEFGTPALVCGGFPCQPVSLAGLQRGADDERWLWPEFARLLRVLRPALALLENVPGLLTGGLAEVLGDLAEIGYDAEWSCISACAMGAPHSRYRVFVVAYPHRGDGQARLGDQPDWQGSLRSRDHPAGSSPYRAAWVGGPPDDARMVDGLPDRLDWRNPNTALGNAVVPEVAEWIGRQLMEVLRTSEV